MEIQYSVNRSVTEHTVQEKEGEREKERHVRGRRERKIVSRGERTHHSPSLPLLFSVLLQ
jgi:hypothetical protein